MQNSKCSLKEALLKEVATVNHSQFKLLEVSRYELLSDKLDIHFFELREIRYSRGKVLALIVFVRDGLLPVTEAAKRAEMNISEFESKLKSS